jgi:oleandomycin transport system ATP-binding protein
MSCAFQAEGLVKRFGKTTALAGVDLAARQGTVVGLLGPNETGRGRRRRARDGGLRRLGVEVCGASQVSWRLFLLGFKFCPESPLF